MRGERDGGGEVGIKVASILSYKRRTCHMHQSVPLKSGQHNLTLFRVLTEALSADQQVAYDESTGQYVVIAYDDPARGGNPPSYSRVKLVRFHTGSIENPVK